MFKILAVQTLFCCYFSILQAQTVWYFEFMPGAGLALPSQLYVRQAGQPGLKFRTSWKTESFKLPLYYSYRLSRYKNGKGWELEMNHLKLRAKELPSEIGNFSITHGFNHIWVNRGWDRPHFSLKTGAGIVLAHPENTVRGMPLNEKKGIGGSGYYISGPTIHAGIQRHIQLSKHWFLPVEAKISLAFARVPVSGGHADVPVAAIHLQAGLGIRYRKPIESK